MNMCYCKNWICCCLLRSSISPKRIKLESCGCAQKKRLEILFPDLIKFLSFQWVGVAKIWDKKCAFFLKWFYVSFTLTHWWKVEFGQKWLIVASPDQFSWIPHVLAHQNCYCPNCFKNFYYFYYFKNRAPFFFGASSTGPKSNLASTCFFLWHISTCKLA